MWRQFQEEFKEFIVRGNVIDLAVGVVIGSAFTSIVNSLVADIITPIVSAVTGKVDLTGFSLQLGTATLTYGNFLQAAVNFLLIAFVLFMLIKVINRLQRKKPELEVEVETKIPAAEQYLKEIRDLLAKEKMEQ